MKEINVECPFTDATMTCEAMGLACSAKRQSRSIALVWGAGASILTGRSRETDCVCKTEAVRRACLNLKDDCLKRANDREGVFEVFGCVCSCDLAPGVVSVFVM